MTLSSMSHPFYEWFKDIPITKAFIDVKLAALPTHDVPVADSNAENSEDDASVADDEGDDQPNTPVTSKRVVITKKKMIVV